MDLEVRPQLVRGVRLIENKTLFGKKFYVLACEERDKYIKVPNDRAKYIELAIILFNGNMSLFEIIQMYPNIRFEQLYTQLKRAGFVDEYDIPSNEIDIMTKEIISVSLEKISNKYRKFFTTYSSVMEKGYAILFLICFVLLIFVGIDIQELKTGFATYRDSVFGGVIMLFFSSVLFTLLHELSHIAVAIKYGKFVEKISLNLYFGILPMCYVKCKGLNTLQTKEKLHVVIAGIITNFMAAFISLTLLSIDLFSYNTESVLKLIFWGNLFSVFSNLIPTSLSDGYFILSILLGKYDMKMFIFKDLFTRNRKLKMKDYMCYLLYLCFFMGSIAMISYSAVIWVNDLFVGTSLQVRNIAIGLACIYLLLVFFVTSKKIFRMRKKYEK